MKKLLGILVLGLLFSGNANAGVYEAGSGPINAILEVIKIYKEHLEKTKKGYKTNLKIQHPFIKGKEMPLFIANFVLMDYGLGAIFGCPAHDQRDLDFAIAYNLEVIPVVRPFNVDEKDYSINKIAYTNDGLIINSDFLNNLTVEKAKINIIKIFTEKGLGKQKTRLLAI